MLKKCTNVYGTFQRAHVRQKPSGNKTRHAMCNIKKPRIKRKSIPICSEAANLFLHGFFPFFLDILLFFVYLGLKIPDKGVEYY